MSNNLDALSAASGMPSGKKSRRGKRSRGLGTPPSGKGSESPSTQTHLDSIKASEAAGDNQGAKLSALALANALHKKQKAAVATNPLRPAGPVLESDGQGGAVPQGIANQTAFGQ